MTKKIVRKLTLIEIDTTNVDFDTSDTWDKRFLPCYKRLAVYEPCKRKDEKRLPNKRDMHFFMCGLIYMLESVTKKFYIYDEYDPIDESLPHYRPINL